MTFRITFKTPDVFDQIEDDHYTRKELERFLDRWITYGEYVTIEFDTDAGTAKVVER